MNAPVSKFVTPGLNQSGTSDLQGRTSDNNDQRSVRGLVTFFGQASVINQQYTRCTLSVSVYTAKHNL